MLLLLLVVLGVRLVQVQGFEDGNYASAAADQRLVSTTLVAQRGDITDRSGNVLASTVDGRAVYAEPRTIAKSQAACATLAARPQAPGEAPRKACTPEAIAQTLSPLLGLPAADLTEKLTRDTAFVYLVRDKDIPLGDAVSALGLTGIGVLTEGRRAHPGGDLAANVIGFTDRDDKGAAGVELGWQSQLAGKDGTASREVDKAGRTIPSADQSKVDAVAGTGVQLTLDRDLQWYAQQMVAAKVAQTQALNGTAVVMDVRTGEILALATAPSFNADDPGATDVSHRGNPAVSEVYEPGSVTKIVTAAAALESGVVAPDTVLSVPDHIEIAGHTFNDSHHHPVEQMTFTGVIVESSNVGTIQVAKLLGEQRVHDALVRFGFGAKTGLGLPGESKGVLPDVKDWSGTSIANIPIGQGVSANAVQVASVYATVANNGVRVTPSIVKATVAPDGTVTPAPAPTSARVISEDVARQLQLMLEGVVSSEGTAPLAAIPGYRIAGKTGTAQRTLDGVRGYAAGHYTSSFVGFAPADAPRLVTAVVLQDTGKTGDYFGGSVAGPVFKDIMGFALRSLQVPPTGTTAPQLLLRVG